jgi:hypothetical protein
MALVLGGCPSGGGTVHVDQPGGAAAGGSGSGSGAGDPQPGLSAAGTPGPAPSPEGLCDLAKRSLDRAVTCLPADKRDSLASTGQVLSGLLAAPPAGLRAAAGSCAQIVANLDKPAPGAGPGTKCTIALTDDERARITAYLAYRITPAKTGDAATDTVLTDLARLRNQMCGCVDKTCAIDVNHGIDNLGQLPDAAPASARTDFSLMIDELGRCANKLR